MTVGDQEDGFYVDMELAFLIYHHETRRLIRRTHDALLARPARTAYVKRLMVYVIEGLAVDLLNLVDVLRAHLLELDIAVHDEVSFGHDDTPDEEHPDTCREFWAATTRLAPMTRLRRLKADIGSRELHDIAALLRWGPELASLDLAIATGFDPDRDSVTELAGGWPSMGNLRTLRLREVEVDFLPFIAAMIEHAPRLRALTIHSLFDDHERIPTAVAKVLRRKESLRYLEWVDVSPKMPLVMDGTELLADGFESLETVVQGGQPWSPLRYMSSWPVSNAHRPGETRLRKATGPSHLAPTQALRVRRHAPLDRSSSARIAATSGCKFRLVRRLGYRRPYSSAIEAQICPVLWHFEQHGFPCRCGVERRRLWR